MLKRIISLSLIIVMMVSLAGCKLPKATSVDTQTNTNNTESVTSKQAEKERVIEEAKTYLEEKYPDDEFSYISGRSPDGVDSSYGIGFTSKIYDDQQVIVYGVKKEKPDSTICDYYDNYYQYSMQNEANEYFADDIKECFGNDVEFRISLISTGYTVRIVNENKYSFNDCLREKMAFVNIYIYSEIQIDDNEENIYSFLNKILESDVYVDVSYLCLKVNSLDKIKNKSIEYMYDNTYELFEEREHYSVYGEITAYGKQSY